MRGVGKGGLANTRMSRSSPQRAIHRARDILFREGMSPREWAGTAGGLTWIVPLLWLGVLFVLPLGITVVYAFAHAGFGTETIGFTLANFRTALSGFSLHVFVRTLEFAVAGTALCVLVATPLAYTLARKAGRFGPVLLIVVLIPFFTSFLVRTLSWRTLLEPNGSVARLLNFLHLHNGSLNWLDAPPAVFIGIVYAYLPLMALPLYVAFSRIPSQVLESADDLGAGSLRRFVTVTLPLARPGITAGLILTAVPMTGEFVIPALLGGNKGVLMGGLISSQYLQAQDIPLGSAMATLVLLVLGVMVVAFTRLTRGFDEVPQ
jgi:spermidine/putrescine transport system permease protein